MPPRALWPAASGQTTHVRQSLVTHQGTRLPAASGAKPAPGRFESGREVLAARHGRRRRRGLAARATTSSTFHGALALAARAAPRAVHGCRQTPEEIAAGTRITALADDVGCLVLLPRQKAAREPVGMLELVRHAHDAGQRRGRDRRRAGPHGAARVPRSIASACSSRACRGRRARGRARRADARSSSPAWSCIRASHAARRRRAHGGARRDEARRRHRTSTRIAREARARRDAGRASRAAAGVHGERDDVVAPRNAVALVRQYLALNGHPAGGGARGRYLAAAAADREARETTPAAAR